MPEITNPKYLRFLRALEVLLKVYGVECMTADEHGVYFIFAKGGDMLCDMQYDKGKMKYHFWPGSPV